MTSEWFLVDQDGLRYPLEAESDAERLRTVIGGLSGDDEEWLDFTPAGAEFPVHVHLNRRCSVIGLGLEVQGVEPPTGAVTRSRVNDVEIMYGPVSDRAWNVSIPHLGNRLIGQVQRFGTAYHFTDGASPAIETTAALPTANAAVGFYLSAHPELLAE